MTFEQIKRQLENKNSTLHQDWETVREDGFAEDDDVRTAFLPAGLLLAVLE